MSCLAPACGAQAPRVAEDSQILASAKTAYFKDESGVDAVGNKASVELAKWGRFQIVPDPKQADLILVLSTDPHQGGNLILAGGQTASIDPQGHVEEDRVPTHNKLEPVHYAYLIVTDTRTGAGLWTSSERWGGLLTGFDNAGERLVKRFEKEAELADAGARLKLVRSVNPAHPVAASTEQFEGTVVVRIVVDKQGTVSSAKAMSGPPELLRASVDAAKQWQFEAPDHAPVTAELEVKYGLEPKPCAPGEKGKRGTIQFAERLPMKSDHPGELKVLSNVNVPLPLYPAEAQGAGIEGDLELQITVTSGGEVVGARVLKSLSPEIDKAALATVRTWKFKVTRGEQAGFPVKLLYRVVCFSSDRSASLP